MADSDVAQPSITLVAEREDGGRAVHELDPGQSILIGTSGHCGLRLEDDQLSGFHCLVSFEDGTMWVQDWASGSGTFINGEPINTKVAVAPEDELRLGRYRISAVFPPSGAFRSSGNAEPPASLRDAPGQAAACEEQRAAEPGEPGAAEYAAELSPPRSRDFGAAWFEEPSFEQETIELLRAEVEELQGVLAQRDAQLAELTAPAGGMQPFHEEETGENSEALLARLEELLDEAARGDERVGVLEDLLCAAEEANQAEQEERRQLEGWVADIERRIGQRDEEHRAEMEALRLRLHEMTEQRAGAERQLQQAAARGSAPQCYEEMLERLQQRNQELQDQLATVQAERSALAKRLESAGSGQDQSLREERSKIAQERAMVSRLRCDLSRKLAALEEAPKSGGQADREAATRIQTLREHLREIHQQEKLQQQEATLASRIARLWKRIEN